MMRKRKSLYLNAYADVDPNTNANTDMPMPRFPNGLFEVVFAINVLFSFYSYGKIFLNY